MKTHESPATAASPADRPVEARGRVPEASTDSRTPWARVIPLLALGLAAIAYALLERRLDRVLIGPRDD